jgi:uncharacterized membrane protein
MTQQWALAIVLHQLATLVWVGGMFFAHMALRPAANALLDPPMRLPLMRAVLDRFFPWVWISIAVLWGSGYWLFAGVFGGRAPLHVHLMMGIALVMTLLFAYIWFGAFRRMRAAVAGADWPAAGAAMATIRVIILTNLILGLITAAIGAGGRFL